MKKKIHAKLNIAELGTIVSEMLQKHDIEVVLTGGAVVSIYSHNEYQSYDLDFIVEGLGKKVDVAMKELGFSQTSGRPYSHPNTLFTIEFPSGPLGVGSEPVHNINELQTDYGILRLLPPTECVMDRLSSYYNFKDRQALDQAVQVAKEQPIDLKRVKAWSKREGKSEKYKDFLDQLKAKL